jgi:hypothetical protein
MMMFKQIRRLPEFDKDLKKLAKKFRTLEDDIKVFEKTALNMFHKLDLEYDGIVPIEGLGIETPKIYKVTKFACKALKGRGAKSGIRITYAYFSDDDVIEYIEMYFKADQENEDRERMKRYKQGKESK